MGIDHCLPVQNEPNGISIHLCLLGAALASKEPTRIDGFIPFHAVRLSRSETKLDRRSACSMVVRDNTRWQRGATLNKKVQGSIP